MKVMVENLNFLNPASTVTSETLNTQEMNSHNGYCKIQHLIVPHVMFNTMKTFEYPFSMCYISSTYSFLMFFFFFFMKYFSMFRARQDCHLLTVVPESLLLCLLVLLGILFYS